jgi:myosin heavy subunit
LLNVLQNKVESLEKQKSDLEAQNEEKVEENSKLTTEIQRMKEEIEGKILEQKRLTEVCLNGINSLNNKFSTLDKDNNNSKEIRDDLLRVKGDFSEMNRKLRELQGKVVEEESKNLEIERENSTCLNEIKSLTEVVSKQGEHSLGLQNKIAELEEKFISQKNPPNATNFSIGKLTYVSFIHLLVLSFFVNAELLPTHEAFRKKSVHHILYSMTVFFELFFASVFFIAARYQQEFSIEYFGLMMGNLIFSCHMNYMIHIYLSIFTGILWLLGLAVTAFHIRWKKLGSKDKKEQGI